MEDELEPGEEPDEPQPASDGQPREPPYFMDEQGYVYSQEIVGGETTFLGHTVVQNQILLFECMLFQVYLVI